jgi:hypothetical protein
MMMMISNTKQSTFRSNPVSGTRILALLYIFLQYPALIGARGGVAVKALRYKPAGRGFDSPWCHWNFLVT